MATEYVMQRDLDALRTEMHGEFALVRGEMASMEGRLRQDIGGIRQEIGGIRQETCEKIGGVRQELGALHKEMGGLRQEIGDQSRKLVLANVATMIGFGGIVLAATQLA